MALPVKSLTISPPQQAPTLKPSPWSCQSVSPPSRSLPLFHRGTVRPNRAHSTHVLYVLKAPLLMVRLGRGFAGSVLAEPAAAATSAAPGVVSVM